MDVDYSLKPLAALTMTLHHHSGSPTPQFFKIWPPAGVFISLTAKSVPAGTKLVLFGRYVLNIYVGIVQYFLR